MENCVEFDIFIKIDDSKESKTSQQYTSRDNEIRPHIAHDVLSDAIYLPVQNAKETIINFCKRWTHEYIWHKDGFSIDEAKDHELHSLKSTRYVALNGSCTFGDCIEDEWFIAFMILEITKRYYNTAARIYDNDGEFLLIESACHLPKWLEPATSTNRVFIHRGHLHIIPIPRTPAEIAAFPVGNIELHQGIDLVFGSIDTEADDEVESAAFARIKRFPNEIQKQRHMAKVFISERVAYLLQRNPETIAYAVDAFYNRDPFTQKACHTMSHFPPESSIQRVVKMTKTMYAQLFSQHFFAPKVFGKNPYSSDAKDGIAWDVGMKLTCGFEMLMAGHQPSRADDWKSHDFENDANWIKFSNKCKRLAVFKDENSMKKEYIESLKSQKENGADHIRRSIQHILTSYATGVLTTQNETEDSTTWLQLDPAVLESQLNDLEETLVHKDDDLGDIDSGDDESTEDAPNSSNIKMGMNELNKAVEQLHSFLDTQSGIDGVQFPSDVISPEPDLLHTPLVKPSVTEASVIEAIENMLKFEDMEDPEMCSGSISYEEGDDIDSETMAYMDAMDRELRDSSIVDPVTTHKEFDGDEKAIGVNLVENAVESIVSAAGQSNPIQSILGELNIDVNKFL